MKNSEFNFWVPLEFEKASEKGGTEDPYGDMVFWGLASDNSIDAEGEILEPSGFDIQLFLERGLLNLEHFTKRKGSSKYYIGEPLDAKIDGDKFYVKGKLWKDSQIAREFWDTVKTMVASGSTRRPGMSIEGNALERDPMNPKRITKARINHVALTLMPVNGNSWLDIVKGMQKDDYIEPEDPNAIESGVLKEISLGNKVVLLMKDLSIVEKTMDTASMAPLIPESVSKKVFNLESVVKSLDVIKRAVDMKILDNDNDLKEKILKNFII